MQRRLRFIVQDRLRLVAIGVHHVRDPGGLGAFLGQAHQVAPADRVDAEPAGPGHKLLETHAKLVDVAEDADGPQRDARHFVAPDQLGHLLPADEDLVQLRTVLAHGLGQPAVVHPQRDVLTDHAGDHQGPAHAHRLAVRGAQCQGLEQVILGAEAAGKGQVRHAQPAGGELAGELSRGRVEVNAGNTPLLHHPPGAHAGAAGGPVDGQQVDLRLAAPAQGHGQLAQAVRAGLERDPLEAQLAQPPALGQEALLVDEAQPAVPLELLDGPVLEGGLVHRVRWIGGHDVPAALQFQGPLQRIHLDLAADALGALAPFQFDGLQAMLVDDILGHAQAGVLDVHLHQDFAVAAVIAAVGFDAAVHVRGALDLAGLVEFQRRVDAAHVLAAHQGDAAQGGTHREMLPVLAGDLGGAQRPGEHRSQHGHLAVPAIGGADIHLGEGAGVGIALHAVRQSIRTQGVALNIEMRIVNRIVLVTAGGHFTERTRIDQFPSTKGGGEDLAVALASVHASRAKPGAGHNGTRAVGGQGGIVGIRSLEVHGGAPGV